MPTITVGTMSWLSFRNALQTILHEEIDADCKANEAGE